MTPAPVNLAQYREQHEQQRAELAAIEAKRKQLLQAIRATETLIAAGIAPEQPLLPIEGLQRALGRRATTRHGRAAGSKLKPMDRKVLRVIGKGPISFAVLQERTGINQWTLRDSIARLMVSGQVKRFGLARATRFAKASLKAEPDRSLLGFLINNK